MFFFFVRLVETSQQDLIFLETLLDLLNNNKI